MTSRRALAAAMLLAAAVSVHGARANEHAPRTVTVTVTVAAAGDIACDPRDPKYNHGRGVVDACHAPQTAKLIEKIHPTIVLGLGDMQYEGPKLTRFNAVYDRSWGKFKNITYSTDGNHDRKVGPKTGFCEYFGNHACPDGHGYYSLDVGAWHVVSLDSGCATGCGRGSPQELWLRADLAAHRNLCTLAMWHVPRWTIGQFSDDPRTAALVSDLYASGVDLLLTGHDHLFARFAPQTPGGRRSARGIREFVVGTGGVNHVAAHYRIRDDHPNLEAWNADTFGVLELKLAPTFYHWRFVPDLGSPGSFTDSGTTACHR